MEQLRKHKIPYHAMPCHAKPESILTTVVFSFLFYAAAKKKIERKEKKDCQFEVQKSIIKKNEKNVNKNKFKFVLKNKELRALCKIENKKWYKSTKKR